MKARQGGGSTPSPAKALSELLKVRLEVRIIEPRS
jgi:hypothetical protein